MFDSLPQEHHDALGKANYEGYLEISGGRSLKTGDELPSWEDQDSNIRMAWTEGALHVIYKTRELGLT